MNCGSSLLKKLFIKVWQSAGDLSKNMGKNSVAQHEIFNIISRDREILRKITQNFGSGSVLFTKLHDLTLTKKFTCPLMICTPVSNVLKSANDNTRMRVAA